MKHHLNSSVLHLQHSFFRLETVSVTAPHSTKQLIRMSCDFFKQPSCTLLLECNCQMQLFTNQSVHLKYQITTFSASLTFHTTDIFCKHYKIYCFRRKKSWALVITVHVTDCFAGQLWSLISNWLLLAKTLLFSFCPRTKDAESLAKILKPEMKYMSLNINKSKHCSSEIWQCSFAIHRLGGESKVTFLLKRMFA